MKRIFLLLCLFVAPAFGQITSTAPQLRFSESDQSLPAGRFRFSVSGDVFSLEKNTHASGTYGTKATAFSVDAAGQFSIGGTDVILVRDAANVLALKNSTTAQTFRVYGTTTGSKYSSVSNDGTSGYFQVVAGQNLALRIGTTNAWLVDPTYFTLYPGTTNTYDLGSSSQTVRTGYFGTSVVMGASSSPASNAACTAGTFYWDASYIYICTATGVVKRAALTGGY